MTPRTRTGIAVLMIVWAIVGIAAGWNGRWDVVTAMVLSYALGGAMNELGDLRAEAEAEGEEKSS